MIPIGHIFGSPLALAAGPLFSLEEGAFVLPLLTFLAIGVATVVIASFIGTRFIRIWWLRR